MMRKRVVFFGAGASYGARDNPSPPLGKYLHKWVLKNLNNQIKKDYDLLEASEKLRIIQKLKSKLEKAASYEALANELLTTGDKACLFELNFRLSAFMTPPLNSSNENEEPRVDDSFVEKHDFYDKWLKKTVEKAASLNDFTFITLNYDCLLERAICRTFFPPQKEEGQCLCTHVYYPFIGGPTSGVEVLKLHGSINWIGNILGNPETDEGPNAISYDENNSPEYNSIEVVPTCIGKCDDQDPSELIMSTYAPGKPVQTNQAILKKRLPDLARKRIREAQKIEIIGVHIPPNQQDDPSLWDLFQELRGKNVYFINPSEVENNLAKFIFDFNTIQKSFKEYVDPQT